MKKYHPGKVPPFTSEGLKSFLSPPPTTYANIVDLVGASSLWLCLSRGPICGWSGVEDWRGVGASWILPHFNRFPNAPALPVSQAYLDP